MTPGSRNDLTPNQFQSLLIRRYHQRHPSLTLEEAAMEWITRFAAIFRWHIEHNNPSRKN